MRQITFSQRTRILTNALIYQLSYCGSTRVSRHCLWGFLSALSTLPDASKAPLGNGPVGLLFSLQIPALKPGDPSSWPLAAQPRTNPPRAPAPLLGARNPHPDK